MKRKIKEKESGSFSGYVWFKDILYLWLVVRKIVLKSCFFIKIEVTQKEGQRKWYLLGKFVKSWLYKM